MSVLCTMPTVLTCHVRTIENAAYLSALFVPNTHKACVFFHSRFEKKRLGRNCVRAVPCVEIDAGFLVRSIQLYFLRSQASVTAALVGVRRRAKGAEARRKATIRAAADEWGTPPCISDSRGHCLPLCTDGLLTGHTTTRLPLSPRATQHVAE